MASDVSKKLFEKVTSSQYALLRSLTDAETIDARGLERTVTSIVRDRFELARGFIKAARVLAKSKDPLVRRTAVSRAYYGAYQAARAMFFEIKRHDQDNHEVLIKELDNLVPGHSAGNTLRELRYLPEMRLTTLRTLFQALRPRMIPRDLRVSLREAFGVPRS